MLWSLAPIFVCHLTAAFGFSLLTFCCLFSGQVTCECFSDITLSPEARSIFGQKVNDICMVTLTIRTRKHEAKKLNQAPEPAAAFKSLNPQALDPKSAIAIYT